MDGLGLDWMALINAIATFLTALLVVFKKNK